MSDKIKPAGLDALFEKTIKQIRDVDPDALLELKISRKAKSGETANKGTWGEVWADGNTGDWAMGFKDSGPLPK